MSTETSTELKLREASIQLQLAIQNSNNNEVFRAGINAFISAARSVTLIMQTESSGNEELLAWYRETMESLKQLPLLKFFNEQRRLTEHLRVINPVSHTVPIREVIADGENASEQATMQIWVFDNISDYIPGDTGNVFRLCEQYFLIVKDLVQEWLYRKAVIENPRDVIAQQQAHLSRKGGQVLAMRSVLSNARNTIELFNDVLKRFGDSSHDDWAKHMLLEIDRMLYPEYFANAPAVPPDTNLEAETEVEEQGQGERHLAVHTILLSPTEATADGDEGVYATIRNDYAKNKSGKSIYGKEYGFEMWGVQLKGRLALPMAGFKTAEEAEDAARRAYKALRY